MTNKYLESVYKVDLTFSGDGGVWMRFGGGWSSEVKFVAEFVGMPSLVEWLQGILTPGSFVPAQNDSANESELRDWWSILNALSEAKPTDPAAVGKAIAKHGHLSIILEDGDHLTELKLIVTPVSMCSYAHYEDNVRVSFWLQDTRPEDTIVLVGAGLHSIYNHCSDAFGEPFTNAFFSQLELATNSVDQLDDLRLEYGQWVVKLEMASPGADFSEPTYALHTNPVLNSYRIQSTEELLEDHVSMHRITLRNDTLGQMLFQWRYLDIPDHHYVWALMEFHLNNNPYLPLLEPVVVADSGERYFEVFSVETGYTA